MNWVNAPSTATPISAANLNIMDAGIAAAAVSGSIANADITAGAAIAVSKLAAGSAGQFLGGTTPAYAYPPGTVIDYKTITSNVNVVSTTEGTPTAVITGNAVTYTNVLHRIEFFSNDVAPPTTDNGSVTILLMLDGASIGRLAYRQNAASPSQAQGSLLAAYYYTPTAGSHTFSIAAFATSTTGTPYVQAGAGGASTAVPAYIRTTIA